MFFSNYIIRSDLNEKNGNCPKQISQKKKKKKSQHEKF